jgi:hypothetical protein
LSCFFPDQSLQCVTATRVHAVEPLPH